MPANQSLQWVDIDDFTSGIWDDNAATARFAAPVSSFRRLDDYQPIKGGGLRAFRAATAFSMSGIGANETPCGIFARNGVSRAAGVGGTGTDSTDMVLVTISTADFKHRIYRLDGTVGAPAWSLRFTSAAHSSVGHQITDFAYFKDSAGVEWYLISIFSVGLISMRLDFTVASNTGNDGLCATLNASMGGPLLVSQARIIISGGNDDKLYYSSVGLTTGLSTGTFLQVTPNRSESNISILSAIEPSDLLVGKEGAPWVEINGDITSSSTPVRELSDDHHQRQDKQQVPRVPGGVAFIAGSGRVFITDGRQFQALSNQVAAHALQVSPGMVGAGTMGYLNSLLFAPGPSGYTDVYDFDTQCWFRSSAIQAVFSWGDPYGGKMFCANHSSTAAAVSSFDLFSGSRVSTGVIQTVPFADKNGRNISIRELQLFVECFAASEFKFELLDEGDSVVSTRYSVIAAAEKDVISVKFPNTKSDYLSVRITPRALDGASEAPAIERLRIGFGINNLVGVG